MDRCVFRLFSLLIAFLPLKAWAVAYSLPAETFGACTGAWSAASNTCGSRVVFQPGDTLTVTQALTLRADAGFELKGDNSLGEGAPVALVSTYGAITAGTGSRVNGSLTSASGIIELTGTRVSGPVEGKGVGSMTESLIAGDVRFQNGLTAVGSDFSGAITVSNGSISLTGGRVEGLVSSDCCTVTTNGTDLGKGITARSGISVTGGVIAGDFLLTTNNDIALADLVMTSGTIEAFNIQVSNSQLGSQDSQVSLTANGNRLEILNHSTVYGSVVVDNTYGKLTIDGTSAVYGTCRAESRPNTNNNVYGNCGAGAAPEVDHYRLHFSTPQFSCEPIPVLIRACADSSCSRLAAVNKTLTLSPSGRWLGGGTVTLAGTGTATAYLKRIPGTVRLGVAGEIARCDNGDCELEILRSGFVLGIPEVIAGAETRVDIQAMRLVEGSEACVADRSFADGDKPRELTFWSRYGLPTSGTRPVWINNQAIGGAEGAATSVSLRFDQQARSSITLRYDDAGALRLHARFVGSGEEEGLDMQGSARFVARPAGFCIRADAAGCEGPECPLFTPNDRVVRAGDAFDLLITPVAHAEGQALCSNADARQTPNFTARLRLSAPVQTPAGGVDGPLDITEYPHPLGGTYRLKDQKVHEVGSFRIEARSEDYEGLAPFHSVGELIGRFAPAYLDAKFNIPALQAGCAAGFSYQGQPIGFAVTPELTITGKSRNGATTRNYDRGEYWKLDDELAPALAFASGKPGAAGRLSLGRFQRQPDAVHDGSKTYRPEGELVYQRPSGAPGAGDAPFSPELVLTMAPDELTDRDATCHGEPGCAGLESTPFGFVNPASDIRLGRLRIGNAHGSELTELALPVAAEYFDGQGYRRNALDSCTRFDPADAEPFAAVGPGGATPVLSYQGNDAGGAYRLQAGAGAYLLSAPGVGGSQRVRFPDLPDWLTHDWDGDGVPEAPSGLATFGIYRGHDRVIFRRELIGR